MSLPLIAATCLFSPTFMAIFGHEFVRGAVALTILSVAMGVNVAVDRSNTILLMGGGSVANLCYLGVALALNVALNLILIPPYGFVGASIAWSIAIVITNIAPGIDVDRRWGIHPVSRGLLRVLAYVGVLVVAPGLVVATRVGTGLSVVTATLCIAGGAYTLALWRARDVVAWRASATADHITRPSATGEVTRSTVMPAQHRRPWAWAQKWGRVARSTGVALGAAVVAGATAGWLIDSGPRGGMLALGAVGAYLLAVVVLSHPTWGWLCARRRDSGRVGD